MRHLSLALLSLATLFPAGCDRDRVNDSVPSDRTREASAIDAGTTDVSALARAPYEDAGGAGGAGGRDRARLVLEAHCGRCHIGHYDTAIPGALAVFDLSETDWAANLSGSQMQSIDRRLTDMLGPEREPMVPGQDTDVSVDERDVVRSYLVRLGAELPADRADASVDVGRPP